MEFKPKITVDIEITPYQHKVIRKELADSIVYNTFGKLDFPSSSAGVFEKMLCTDSITIARVMKSRKDIAKMLSSMLTEALLDLMGAKDTEMGYEK